MRTFYETNVRSILKAITFRVFVLASDAFVIYGITRQIDTTWKLVVASNLMSTLIYYVHERLWNQSHWGKHHAVGLLVPMRDKKAHET
ncbi:MAG: DUF2061 domain-containing protein, partial [Bdellovibrionota bacterium]